MIKKLLNASVKVEVLVIEISIPLNLFQCLTFVIPYGIKIREIA